MCIKGYKAGAAIVGKRFAKFSAADTVVQAAAATDLIIGVVDLDGSSGDIVDVTLDGLAKVTCGGNVTRGQLLTADSAGKAVTAAPTAGVNARVGALALSSGVSGDIIDIIVLHGLAQGEGVAT